VRGATSKVGPQGRPTVIATGKRGLDRPAGLGALRLRGFRLRLHLLLVFAHATQARRVDDVCHGSERAIFAENAGRLLPAWRLDVKLLAEQRDEDLRFLLAEPGQGLDALEQLLAVGHPLPDGSAIAAIHVGDRTTELLRALGHRTG